MPLDPNAIFMHDTSETPAAQRFVVNLGTTGGDGVHRVCPLDVNDTTNRTKCQIFLKFFIPIGGRWRWWARGCDIFRNQTQCGARCASIRLSRAKVGRGLVLPQTELCR